MRDHRGDPVHPLFYLGGNNYAKLSDEIPDNKSTMKTSLNFGNSQKINVIPEPDYDEIMDYDRTKGNQKAVAYCTEHR